MNFIGKLILQRLFFGLFTEKQMFNFFRLRNIACVLTKLTYDSNCSHGQHLSVSQGQLYEVKLFL